MPSQHKMGPLPFDLTNFLTMTSPIALECFSPGTSYASKAAILRHPSRFQDAVTSLASGPASGPWATSDGLGMPQPPTASGHIPTGIIAMLALLRIRVRRMASRGCRACAYQHVPVSQQIIRALASRVAHPKSMHSRQALRVSARRLRRSARLRNLSK